ncbi:MAG: universal stress protein [Erythrobacter sp.]|jgi:nucleotide-binding universal stress UspA family protein|nr:universal stress protein [Erythrobacter sp.]
MTKSCIIVATDFTSRADRAIDRALQLGRDTKRPLRFIHAIDPDTRKAPDRAELDRRMEQAVGYTEGTDQGGGPIEFGYPEGSPPSAIARECERTDCDMLLIGPARYNSLGDYFVGTAVDYVLRCTEKPVLVVKKRVRHGYDEIIAGTDFSAASAHAIITAARLFPQAKIHICHAWHVPFEGFNRDGYVATEMEGDERAKLAKFVELVAEREPRLADATTGLLRGGAFQAVKDALEDHPDALVVVGSHGASGFRQATLGSNTSDMLRFLDADMLVVNTRAAEG